MSKYSVGQRVKHSNGCLGVVVTSFKFPNDICIEWDNGQNSSYDEDWLGKEVTKLSGVAAVDDEVGVHDNGSTDGALWSCDALQAVHSETQIGLSV